MSPLSGCEATDRHGAPTWPPYPQRSERPGKAVALLGYLDRLGLEARTLPGDHAPVLAGLRVDRQVTDGEALLLAVPLHVHLRHAVDDADPSVHARAALAGRDPP